MRFSKNAIKAQFNEYRRGLNAQSLSEHTVQCYLSRASQFVEFLLSCQSDPVDVEWEARRYCDVLLEESYAAATVNAFLTVIETFVSRLTEQPIKLSRIEARETEAQVLTPEQRVRFLASISATNEAAPVHLSSRDRLLLLLLFHTGISIRQLIELNVEDLFVTPHIGKIIRSSTINVSETTLADEFVSLNHPSRRAALQWLIERDSIASSGEQALFVNAGGQRITPAGAGHLVKSFGWKIQMELSGRILRNTWRQGRSVDAPVTQPVTATAAPVATPVTAMAEEHAENALLQQSRLQKSQGRGNRRFSTPIASA